MTWKKHFKPVNTVLPVQDSGSSYMSSTDKFNSWLPEVYMGPPDRLQRYVQYEQMDLDHEVAAALDTIAEFSTQKSDHLKVPFEFEFSETPTPTESKVLERALRQWCHMNEFNKRLFRIFRSTLMYGDQFFVRDPETYKLFWIDPNKVEKIIVNESQGKKIETYFVKDMDLNMSSLVATNQIGKGSQNQITFPQATLGQQANKAAGISSSAYTTQSGNNNVDQAFPVDAEYVVHLSLTEGLDGSWPFGTSVLEPVFKTYKQKSMLEDAMLIYRIHRAPERRVFFIDVGNMPPAKAQQYLERVRYEVQQKRIPNRSGGGSNIADSSYNPLSTLEDYFFAQTSDGRGSKVETLPGGENLGCFSLDTKVKLLDGRDLSIKEIENELDNNNELWTYSCHPITGEVVPGIISWAGKTKSDAKVLKISLDNGEEVICTPDHKFPIIGRGFVEAKDLYIGQSMTPVYTKNEQISKYKKNDYEKVYCPHNKDWFYTHRLVMDYLKDCGIENTFVFDDIYEHDVKDVRHHVDHNRYNNSPTNLAWMNWKDHQLYHKSKGFDSETQQLGTKAAAEKMKELKENNIDEYNSIVKKQVESRNATVSEWSKEKRLEVNENISKSIREYYNSLSASDKEKRDTISINNFAKGAEKFQNLLETDLEFRKYFSECVKQGQENSKIQNPMLWKERSKKISEANYKRWKLDSYYDTVFESQKINYDTVMLERFTELYINSQVSNKQDFANILEKDIEFMKYYRNINEDVHTNSHLSQFTVHNLSKMLSCFNMTWESFKITHMPIVNDDVMKELVSCYRPSMSQVEFVESASVISDNYKSRHLIISELKKRGIDNFKTFKVFAEHRNHRILAIEEIEEAMDVGTLTIDINEQYHDYHTFALSAGIFTKNSIDDMLYFNNKMFRALGVPSSYLPTGPDDGSSSVSDGRVGTAFIQEFRFTETCKRHQRSMVDMLDKEFKLYLKHKGITVDNSSFELAFPPPQNFSEYRQIELDAARSSVFGAFADIPYISNRFALKKWGGFSEEELLENERMWREEKGLSKDGSNPDEPGLGQVGVSSSDMVSDVDIGDEEFGDDEDLGADDIEVGDDEVEAFGEE